MQHPLLTGGSAFRSKLPKEPTTKDIESVIVNSGLLGKKPTQYKIKYSKPSLADQKPPQHDPDIWLPSNRNNGTQHVQSRPSTAIAANRNRSNNNNNNFNYLNQNYNYNQSVKTNTPRTTRTPRQTRHNTKQRPQTPSSANNGMIASSSSLSTAAPSKNSTAIATARNHIAASNSQTEKIILKPESSRKKSNDINTVFYGRVLNSSEPPSSVNFIQLNEILTRLLKQQDQHNKVLEKIERIRKKREMKLNQEEEQQNAEKEIDDKKGEIEGEIDQEQNEDKENDEEIIEEEEEAEINEEEEEEFSEEFLKDIENVDINHIYNNIFGEVIRQYFVECSAQGDLLGSCRSYFNFANIKIPQIKKHYDKIVNSVVSKTIEDRESIQKLGPEIESNEKHRLHLQKLIDEFRTNLKILTDHHDVLMNQTAVAFRELSAMQQSVNQLNSRLESKNRKLMELIEELRSLDSISASYTSDTIRFADNLRQIRVQQESGRKQIQINQTEVDRLKESILLIDKDIVKLTEDIEKSRIKPVITFMGIQVDLVSRRLFKEPRTIESAMKETVTERKKFTGSLFQKVRDEYMSKSKKYGTTTDEGIVLDSYEDYAKFKEIILKYEQELHMSPSVIESAERGEFAYTGHNTDKSHDFIRLFASNLAKNIVSDAIQKTPFRRISTQTLVEQQEFQKEEETPKFDKSSSRLLSMINADYSQRLPQPLEWIIQMIRELYNAKTIEDEQILTRKKSVTELRNFPLFIYDYLHKKHKIQFYADQICWDVYITSHEHKERIQEIDVFIGFLDEEFDAEQLAFYLIMRSDCLKIGAPVTVFTRDTIEKCNEYFLSNDQIESLLKKWWFERYKKEYFNSVMESSIPRPSIHLEMTKKYVAMNDFLLKNVIFYRNDAVERLNGLLLKYRIKPRLTLKQFQNLVNIIIPSIQQTQIEDFYRSTVSKSGERTNIDVDQFGDVFMDSSVIMKRCRQVVKEDGSTGNNPAILNAVSENWELNRSRLLEVFNFFQSQSSLQSDNLTLRNMFEDAQRHLNNLNQAIAMNDGEMVTVYYYQFLFSLDALFSAMTNDISPESLISMECSIRESWLEKVFY